MTAFSKKDADQLKYTLQDAVVKCSERCLYQSAKWSDLKSCKGQSFAESATFLGLQSCLLRSPLVNNRWVLRRILISRCLMRNRFHRRPRSSPLPVLIGRKLILKHGIITSTFLPSPTLTAGNLSDVLLSSCHLVFLGNNRHQPLRQVRHDSARKRAKVSPKMLVSEIVQGRSLPVMHFPESARRHFFWLSIHYTCPARKKKTKKVK